MDRRRARSTSDLDSIDGIVGEELSKCQIPLAKLPSAAIYPAEFSSKRPRTDSSVSSKSDLLVMKFGGSSLAGAIHLRRVAGIVHDRLSQHPILILSAMGKTTNQLLGAAEKALSTGEVDSSEIRETHESTLKTLGVPIPESVNKLLEELNRILAGVALLREVSTRTRDLLVSFGERLSIRVFSAFYNKEYHSTEKTNGNSACKGAEPFDSWEIGMLTSSGAAGGGSASSAYTSVEVLPSSYGRISEKLEHLKTSYAYIPVVTGYIAKDQDGIITTLGRDGSDLSATVIGAAIRASEVQIWKDVDGILTTDPRIVPAARPVGTLTFEEAAELSTFGAKVVHPAAVMPAWQASVPISVRNSMAPELPGTRIVAALSQEEDRKGRVAALSSKNSILMFIIRSTRMLGQHGFLAHVFQVFNEFAASVDVIATSEVTVSLTLDKGWKDIDIDGLRKRLESAADVEVKEDLSMLTLITSKRDSTAVLGQAFQIFQENSVHVEMVSQGASNVNVTFVLPGDALTPMTQKLHKVFFEQ